MDDSIAIIRQLVDWKKEGKDVALATVVKTWGSAPRRIGSLMCIDQNMQFQGSVSGGCVETAVIDQAINSIKNERAQLLEFGVSNKQAWEVGLACGGKIEVFVQPIFDQALQSLYTLVDLNDENEPALLMSELSSQTKLNVITTNQIDSHGVFSDSQKELVHNSMRQDRPQIIELNEARYFIHPFNPELNVYIVGAVHIAQQLVPMINQLGFNVHVVDPRGAFATKERFTDVNLIHKWPNQFFTDDVLNHRSAVIALTHDPKFDDPALQAALDSDAFYIGALGSRKTHSSRIERLQQAGFNEEQLSRIHAPIGLDIKASNPTEIALSIASELVFELRKSD